MSPLAELPWPLQTARLSLRPAAENDAAASWAFLKRPEVHRWLSSTPADFESFTERFTAPERLRHTLIAERTSSVIGELKLQVEDAWAQEEVRAQARGLEAELGWIFDPNYGGRGYATEAVDAMLHICFERLKLRRIKAYCFADNDASWRLMERLGMRREAHTVADSLHRDGKWYDGYAYALLRDEWVEREYTRSRAG